MDYYKKYLKYKSKYENLKGGVLVFKQNRDISSTLLKTNMEEGNLSYTELTNKSANFSPSEVQSIKTMINFILPHIEYNGKKLNYEFIKQVSTIGAGTYGVTIANDKLLIKIFKKSSNTIKEIQILEDLFNNSNPALAPNDSINKYYGFMAGKQINKLQKYNNFDNSNINLNTNLFNKPSFKFNSLDFIAKINALNNSDLTNFINSTISENLIFAFFEKASGDLNDFIEKIVPKLNNIQRVKMAALLLSEIKLGFDFLHKTRHLAHYDIKGANLVYKLDFDGNVGFQIIDFGSLTPIDAKGFGRMRIVTSYYRKGSIYDALDNRNYMYDYYCLIFPVLKVLGFKILNFNPEALNSIYNLIKNAWTSSPKEDDEKNKINNIITLLNTNYSKLDLPKMDEDPDLQRCYKIIILWTMFACGFNGTVPLNDINTIK